MDGIIFTGLQASGKSTFYQMRFFKTHIRINLDMLRTRNRESILFNACLSAKQPVVIDNTNPKKADRQRYIRLFKENRFKTIGYYFASSLAQCMERNRSRKGKELLPDAALRGTRNKLEHPNFSEGYDELYYLKIKDDDFVMEEWKDEI